MELLTIDTLGAFDAWRPAWDDLYRADAVARVFVSGRWLRAFLSVTPYPWSIIALHEGDTLVGALPFSVRGAPHRRLPIARELTFATQPFADYQGLLCRPGRERDVVDVFARALSAKDWARGIFSDVADPRIAMLLAQLRDVETTAGEPTRCFAAELPAQWEAFLAGLSKPTRRQLVRGLKLLPDVMPNARFSHGEDDVARDIDDLITLNEMRWRAGISRRAKFRALFLAAHDQGCLRLTVLRDGDRPVAASAAFVDDVRSVVGYYMIGFDPQYAELGPGKIVLAVDIKDSIERGYRTFDFMRGDDAYKQSLATTSSTNAQYTMRRNGVRALALSAAQPLYDRAREIALRRTARSAASD